MSLEVAHFLLHLQHAGVLVGRLFVHALYLALLLDDLFLQFGVETVGLLELDSHSHRLLLLLGHLRLETLYLRVHVLELFGVLFVLFLQGAVLTDHLLYLLVLSLYLEVLLLEGQLQSGDGAVVGFYDGLLVVDLLVVVGQLGLVVIQLLLVVGQGAVLLVFVFVCFL